MEGARAPRRRPGGTSTGGAGAQRPKRDPCLVLAVFVLLAGLFFFVWSHLSLATIKLLAIEAARPNSFAVYHQDHHQEDSHHHHLHHEEGNHADHHDEADIHNPTLPQQHEDQSGESHHHHRIARKREETTEIATPIATSSPVVTEKVDDKEEEETPVPTEHQATDSPKPATTASKKKKKVPARTEGDAKKKNKDNDNDDHTTSFPEDLNYQILSQGQPPKNAYLMIISNEDFIDGALVLGTSLRMNSKMLTASPEKEAHLVILVATGRLSEDSKYRLRFFGFDRIVEVPTLAEKAPGAALKDTFDKLYMFNLTAYEKIVFMDADMVNVKSADDLFKKDYEEGYVGGIGHHGAGGDSYFQTGMMVFRPSTKVFDKIMEEFYSGVPPRGRKYNVGMNGRDGVLVRNVFGESFKIISDDYSRNLNPRNKFPPNLRSLHFRGRHKPWYNRLLPPPASELGKKEFGFAYLRWWEIYHKEIHQKSPEFLLALSQQMEKLEQEEDSTSTKSKKEKQLQDLAVGEDKDSLDWASNSLHKSGKGGDHQLGRATVFRQLLDKNFKELNDQDLEYAKRTLKVYGSKVSRSDVAPIPRPIKPGGIPYFAPFETKISLEGHISSEGKNSIFDQTLKEKNKGRGGEKGDDEDTGKDTIRSPLIHVWMMRGAKNSYVQYTNVADRMVRDYTHPKEFKLIVGDPGASCDAACSTAQLRCLPDYLYSSELQSCSVMRDLFGEEECKECQPGVYWKQHAGNEHPSLETVGKVVKGTKGVCWYNLLHDDRSLPRCDAYNTTTKRLCPCGPEATQF